MVYQLRTILRVIVALRLMSSGVRAQENIQRQHDVDADSWFAGTVATSGMVDLSACVVSGDHVVWKGGFGKADIAQNVPVTTETLMAQGAAAR